MRLGIGQEVENEFGRGLPQKPSHGEFGLHRQQESERCGGGMILLICAREYSGDRVPSSTVNWSV